MGKWLSDAVAKWFEHSPREREVFGSVLCHDRPKSLKTGSSGFSPWCSVMGMAL